MQVISAFKDNIQYKEICIYANDAYECKAYKTLPTPTLSWPRLRSHQSHHLPFFCSYLQCTYFLCPSVCIKRWNLKQLSRVGAKSLTICSFFLWSNDSIKPKWSYTSDRALLRFRLLTERMPEWIFFAMPFEQNKVKGMRGRTRSFQGQNNKVRWMPLCLQNTASLFSKCVSLLSLFSLLQKTIAS